MIENQSENIDNKENDLSDQDNALEDSLFSIVESSGDGEFSGAGS